MFVVLYIVGVMDNSMQFIRIREYKVPGSVPSKSLLEAAFGWLVSGQSELLLEAASDWLVVATCKQSGW